MTPRFDPDFVAAEATIPIYEKGRYQVKIAGHKPFVRMNRKGGVISGVRFSLRMVGQYDSKGKLDRDREGKTISQYTVWTHTEGGWDFAKPFILAGLGFSVNQEAAGNEEIAKYEWWLDGEPVEGVEAHCGNGYAQLDGRIVDVTLDKSSQESEDGSRTFENQEFTGWSPPAEEKRAKRAS